MENLSVAEAKQRKIDTERLWQLQYDRGVRNHGYLSTLQGQNDRIIEEAVLVEKLSGKSSSNGELHFTFQGNRRNP